MDIVKTIVDSITQMLKGLSSGIVDTFENLFIKTGAGDTKQMTTFAIVSLTMLGVGFAFGLVKFIARKIRG